MKALDFEKEAQELKALTGLEIERVLDALVGKDGREKTMERASRYKELASKPTLTKKELIEQDELSSSMLFLFGRGGILSIASIYLAVNFRVRVILKCLTHELDGQPHFKAAQRESRIIERFMKFNLPDASNVELQCKEAKQMADGLLKSVDELVRLVALIDGTGKFMQELWKSFGLDLAGGLIDVYHKFMLGEKPWRDLVASTANFVFERGSDIKLVRAGQVVTDAIIETETVNLERMMWNLSENLLEPAVPGQGAAFAEISNVESVMERFSQLIRNKSLDTQARFAIIYHVWWILAIAMSARLNEITDSSLKKVGEIMSRN